MTSLSGPAVKSLTPEWEGDCPQNELSQFMRYVSLDQLPRVITLFPNQEGVLSLLTSGSVIYVCMLCVGGWGW